MNHLPSSAYYIGSADAWHDQVLSVLADQWSGMRWNNKDERPEVLEHWPINVYREGKRCTPAAVREKNDAEKGE